MKVNEQIFRDFVTSVPTNGFRSVKLRLQASATGQRRRWRCSTAKALDLSGWMLRTAASRWSGPSKGSRHKPKWLLVAAQRIKNNRPLTAITDDAISNVEVSSRWRSCRRFDDDSQECAEAV
ncbi:hypothetical protein OOZ63_17875 [Paucibacter sp. PLA-PC-4]|uniref:hypothetical protein n=1 Tax=Paucibacter sp. PLA-PC-4 TaxID=2993655 RepID=UPI00224B548E|nr:hypothetical protein [Paucibacter sp. PLA-PC-4]MCX2863700.1 hypothetical protein [Paucibacter sp. PLA-PC-4]